MTPEEVGAQDPRTPGDLSAEDPHPDLDVGPTGDSAVDSVLASLDQLEGTTLVDHVTVFESAHEQLRRLLTEAGEGTPGLGHER